MKNYQCYNCKKEFNTQKVYLWGKDNHSFCQSCNKAEISNSEREIQALKREKENPDNKKMQNLSPKPSYWTWIIGISLISITLGVWVVLKKRSKKQNYNNGKKK